MYTIYQITRVLILVLNEARDGTQRAAGGSKFHRMSVAWLEALSPYVLNLVLGTHSRLLCPERRVRPEAGIPLQQTTEMLRNEAVLGFVREDQDLVVHTGRHREPVQLPEHMCHTRKLGRESQDSGGTLQDPLQLVGERLADSIEKSVAAVDARCYEGMDESLRRLLGEHTADPTHAAQVDMYIHTTADACSPGPRI